MDGLLGCSDIAKIDVECYGDDSKRIPSQSGLYYVASS